MLSSKKVKFLFRRKPVTSIANLSLEKEEIIRKSLKRLGQLSIERVVEIIGNEDLAFETMYLLVLDGTASWDGDRVIKAK
ncbi:MAG: hypothetical protein WCX27_03145 [Candidatus Paceibacterota bacterium]|jgi:hypothetical protein